MDKINENKLYGQKKLLSIYILSCQTILHPLSKNFTLLKNVVLIKVL